MLTSLAAALAPAIPFLAIVVISATILLSFIAILVKTIQWVASWGKPKVYNVDGRQLRPVNV